MSSHEKNIIKNKYKNMGGLDQNSYVNNNDTFVNYTYS